MEMGRAMREKERARSAASTQVCIVRCVAKNKKHGTPLISAVASRQFRWENIKEKEEWRVNFVDDHSRHYAQLARSRIHATLYKNFLVWIHIYFFNVHWSLNVHQSRKWKKLITLVETREVRHFKNLDSHRIIQFFFFFEMSWQLCFIVLCWILFYDERWGIVLLVDPMMGHDTFL